MLTVCLLTPYPSIYSKVTSLFSLIKQASPLLPAWAGEQHPLDPLSQGQPTCGRAP